MCQLPLSSIINLTPLQLPSAKRLFKLAKFSPKRQQTSNWQQERQAESREREREHKTAESKICQLANQNKQMNFFCQQKVHKFLSSFYCSTNRHNSGNRRGNKCRLFVLPFVSSQQLEKTKTKMMMSSHSLRAESVVSVVGVVVRLLA